MTVVTEVEMVLTEWPGQTGAGATVVWKPPVGRMTGSTLWVVG